MANRPQEVWLMCLPGYWDRLGWTDSAVPLVVWSCPTKVGLKEFSMIKRDAVTLGKSMNWENSTLLEIIITIEILIDTWRRLVWPVEILYNYPPKGR